MRHNHSCKKILFSKMHTSLLFQDLLFQEVEDSNRRILMQNANIIERTVIIVIIYTILKQSNVFHVTFINTNAHVFALLKIEVLIMLHLFRRDGDQIILQVYVRKELQIWNLSEIISERTPIGLFSSDYPAECFQSAKLQPTEVFKKMCSYSKIYIFVFGFCFWKCIIFYYTPRGAILV